jgi:hypothetical protein
MTLRAAGRKLRPYMAGRWGLMVGMVVSTTLVGIVLAVLPLTIRWIIASMQALRLPPNSAMICRSAGGTAMIGTPRSSPLPIPQWAT